MRQYSCCCCCEGGGKVAAERDVCVLKLLRRVGRVLGGYRILSRKGREGTGRMYPFSEGYWEGVSFLGRVRRVLGGCILSRKGSGRMYPFSEGSEGYWEGTASFLGRVLGGCILSRKGRKGTGRVYPFSEGYWEDV